MTAITYPSSRIFYPSDFTPGLRRNITQSRNPLTRRRKTVEHPGALWEFTLMFTPTRHEDRATIEAFWNRASDADIVISMWHMARSRPLGTLQSNTTTAAAANEGASTINLNATTGLTLKAGDMLSVKLANNARQLLMVVADVTSVSNVMTSVQIVPPLVGAVSSGAEVILNKPTTTFRLEEPFVPAQYSPGFAPAFPVVLVEDPEW